VAALRGCLARLLRAGARAEIIMVRKRRTPKSPEATTEENDEEEQDDESAEENEKDDSGELATVGMIQELMKEFKQDLIGEFRAMVREEMQEMAASVQAQREHMKNILYVPVKELVKKFDVGVVEGRDVEADEQRFVPDIATLGEKVHEQDMEEEEANRTKEIHEDEPRTPATERIEKEDAITPEKGKKKKKKKNKEEQPNEVREDTKCEAKREDVDEEVDDVRKAKLQGNDGDIEKGKVRFTEEMHDETFVTGSTLNMGERRNGSVERHDEGGLDEMMEVFQKHRLTHEELGAAMHTKSKQMQGKYIIYGPESWGYTKTMKAFLREHGEELEEHLDKRMRREGEELQGHVEGGDAETP
jgi:hypothetical protein